MAPTPKPIRRPRLPGCSPRRGSPASDEADENGHPPRSWRDLIPFARSLDAERALERGKILGERRDRPLERGAVVVRELLIALKPSVRRPVFGQQDVDLGKIVTQTSAELGILLHDQRIEERDDLLRAVHVRLEIPE